MKARGVKNAKKQVAEISAEKTKRGRGRPQELADPVTTTIRIERADLDQLDRWAAQRSLSRCQAAAAAFRALR